MEQEKIDNRDKYREEIIKAFETLSVIKDDDHRKKHIPLKIDVPEMDWQIEELVNYEMIRIAYNNGKKNRYT